MGYYMSEYFQNFNHLIKIYIQCTIQTPKHLNGFVAYCTISYTFANHAVYSHKVLGFRLYAITLKESILTHCYLLHS